MDRLAGQLFRTVLALLALTLGGLAPFMGASAQSPTPEQLEVFRNLTPEQQQAVLQNMGQGSGVVSDPATSAQPGAGTPETQHGTTTTPGRTGPAGNAQPETSNGYQNFSERQGDDRLMGGDSVLLDVKVPSDVKAPSGGKEPTDADRELKARVDLILRRNPYKLDPRGVLLIPGVGPIPLAGLTAAQATTRLNSEPLLSGLEMRLTLLPLNRLNVEALKPFGYDLFFGVPSTFAPVTDVPVPADYVVGPGDRIEVQLIGSTEGRYSLTVNRDGRINFPKLGPVAVAGMDFDELRSRIEERVEEQLIGTQAVVTMGELRSVRVFVLGEAERPGSYTVSGLSTITNAIFASGGVKTTGSLRNIQLKRNGALVARLDLYDLLLRGDTSNDVRLMQGDVIFIPPIGPTAGVMGEIRRPAIYEYKGEATAGDLVNLGGGLNPEADPELSKIQRIDDSRDRVVVDVNLAKAQGRATPLRSGDVLSIPAVRPTYSDAVQLNGHVFRPSSFQYRSGMRLTDVLPSVEELKPNADQHYVLILREQPGSRDLSVVSVDFAQALGAPYSDANPTLHPRDEIVVFDLETGRAQYLAPIVEKLKLQATRSEPSRLVRVAGQVRAPGEYPLEPGMTVADLIRAGGGLAQQAFGGEAELARYAVVDGSTRQTRVLRVDLGRALAGDPASDLPLEPFDTLVVMQITHWSEPEIVRLEGEVRFPGDYPIARGETLSSVIKRAGGLTPLGYPSGSVFTREYLRERERQQIDVLTDKMRQDLTVLAMQAAQAGAKTDGAAADTLAVGQSLLSDLAGTEPVGRMVINLERILNAEPGSPDDLVLRGGDRLKVPKRPQEVTVLGEVQNATSFLYDPRLTRNDYINLSGGTTRNADDGRIYVVRANGSVEPGVGRGWFGRGGDIKPGDTIVVPLDVERMRPLPLWQSVTTILFNLAVAVAAVNSF